tara:strand:+ start:180 stop:341 length:162 start_codon:yes stop_codon:yes gene_type:complete
MILNLVFLSLNKWFNLTATFSDGGRWQWPPFSCFNNCDINEIFGSAFFVTLQT